MRLNITARHFKLSESLKHYVENEVRRLKKYYDGIIDIEVILEWEKSHRMVEIKTLVYGTVLTAQDQSEDMKKAINSTVDKLERQILKYKERLKGFEHEKFIDESTSIEDETKLS
jgi:putative sigma-54 modulation protein